MNKLKGKAALVTGSSRGIGRSIALRLAKEGAIVAVHYAKNQKAAEEVIHEIKNDGGQAFLIGAELSSLSSVNIFFEAFDAQLIKQTGSNQFDILVNNAGGGHVSTLEELTDR